MIKTDIQAKNYRKGDLIIAYDYVPCIFARYKNLKALYKYQILFNNSKIFLYHKGVSVIGFK